jgi:hypothetical protein
MIVNRVNIDQFIIGSTRHSVNSGYRRLIALHSSTAIGDGGGRHQRVPADHLQSTTVSAKEAGRDLRWLSPAGRRAAPMWTAAARVSGACAYMHDHGDLPPEPRGNHEHE